MDCHRCVYLRYGGCPHCTHRGHRDVVLRRGDERPYNRMLCKDFVMKKRCSNCKYWKRGRYFADGTTPAARGKCSLGLAEHALVCPMWAQGRTSGRRKESK